MSVVPSKAKRQKNEHPCLSFYGEGGRGGGVGAHCVSVLVVVLLSRPFHLFLPSLIPGLKDRPRGNGGGETNSGRDGIKVNKRESLMAGRNVTDI